ncbi:MAG: GFA family protein [Kofleriaceae bacterium]|jgi:hypothetical protein|nr:GFA family protein [Kofleriaceae bacterium]MBP6839841.1 GFA family protein [Kofleriaceae bacterium]MBP9207378.1 GFA family protein [Kofleriaceae bacterium]
MAETHYQGSCHCGKVRFHVDADLTKPAVACNCSMCGRAGTLLVFVPASGFTLEAGADAMTDYQFGKKHVHHLFCATCGIKAFGRGAGPDGVEMIAVNVRCLDGVDPAAVPLHHYDGKAL